MTIKNIKKEKILFVAAECAPFAKVGGLADVIGSLPKALKEVGANISVIMPYYGSVLIDKKNRQCIKKRILISFNGRKETFNLWESYLPKSDVPIFLIENKRYFSGETYSTKNSDFLPEDFEAVRFLFFSQAVVEIIRIKKFKIIHCHDWHTSLIPFLLKKRKLKTLFTIHNIAFQGIFKAELVNRLLGTKFKGIVNCMENGIKNANIVTTVSPNYAKEILSPEFGFGLDGVLKERKGDLFGIINGIDSTQFNPETDPYIFKNYSIKSIQNKLFNKEYLQKKCFKKLAIKTPVLGMVTRIAEQKGFDLIEKIFPKIIKRDLQLIVLGKGVKKNEDFLKSQAKKNPKKIFVMTKFNEEFAHQIYAGSDMFLMPSFFEPCGLGQMIAMDYGSVPIVRAIGGLKDTVIPVEKTGATGFVFKEYSPKSLYSEIEKALKKFKNKNSWLNIQKNGMAKDFSWKHSAQSYMRLYKKIGF